MRQARMKGAELFVNVTNDNYYPNSRLPQQHFDHARLRAVENGVPLIRACNTGVTAAVDRFGREVARLSDQSGGVEWVKGVLDVQFSAETHRTLYQLWGDKGILALSFILLCFDLRRRIGRSKIFFCLFSKRS
jgi:apolipoprotein N-acyltransferase